MVKRIPLTQGKVALVDDQDYGEMIQYEWHANKGRHKFYAQRNVPKGKGQTRVKMHRVILGVTNPKVHVDHIDGNGLNNQRSNLRIVSYSQNLMNSSGHKKSSSPHKGVSWYKANQKWRAAIHFNGRQIHLGYFDTERDAALAYNVAAVRYFGEFAYLNKL